MCEPKILTTRHLTAVNDHLGWGGTVTSDGDVAFTHRGITVSIDNHAPDDPEYLRLRTGFSLSSVVQHSRLPASATADRALLDRAAAETTRRAKGTKVVIDRDAVLFSVECVAAGPHLLPTVEHLVAVLPRMTSMIDHAVMAFVESLTLAGIKSANLREAGAADLG